MSAVCNSRQLFSVLVAGVLLVICCALIFRLPRPALADDVASSRPTLRVGMWTLMA